MKLFAAVIFFSMMPVATVLAQVPINIVGTVTDSRGATVSSARMTCTGSASPAFSDANGRFSITCLSPRVTVNASGFATATVGFTGSEIAIVLQPSALAATVDVTRIETQLTSTPASVVSVPAADLETSGSLTLDDRLRQVPGFTLFRRAGSSTANPTTQGVSFAESERQERVARWF